MAEEVDRVEKGEKGDVFSHLVTPTMLWRATERERPSKSQQARERRRLRRPHKGKDG